MAHTFEARYRGMCAKCDEPIDVGDEIGYVDDEICCEDCCEAYQDD